LYGGVIVWSFRGYYIVCEEKTMTIKEKIGQRVETLDVEKSKDCDWESNRDDENPKQLPWPDENESKD
jgi:hypothetical protein